MFDIDAILAEEERVVCVFAVDAADLGHLDSTGQHDIDMAAGSRVELPLWMTRAVAAKNMVHVEMPPQYGAKMRDDIRASSIALRLRERSTYYFEVGFALASVFGDNDLMRTLRHAFTGDRFHHILDWCLNCRSEDVTDSADDLTHVERVLFESGRQASREYGEWQRGAASRLRPSAVMASVSRHQRLQDEQATKRARVGTH